MPDNDVWGESNDGTSELSDSIASGILSDSVCFSLRIVPDPRGLRDSRSKFKS